MQNFKISKLCAIFSKNSADLPIEGADLATLDKNFELPDLKF